MNQDLYLIGNPIGHSCSDIIHNTISAHLGLPYCYRIFQTEPDALCGFVQMVREDNIRGFNITIPYKQAILPYLDELDPDARAIGAVNTVVNDKKKLVGYNTDAAGLMRALQYDGVSVVGKKITVLGAGGAARGICYALLKEGAGHITVCNRSVSNAARLAEDFSRFGAITAGSLEKPPARADLLINTTSVGMHTAAGETEGESPVCDLSFMAPDGYVCDIIYNPFQTKLLKLALAAGLRFQNGLYMLIYQGILAYEIWTGAHVPEGVAQEIYQILSQKFNP